MDGDSIQRYYRYSESRWVGPSYYDYPDGEDLGGKLSFCGQMGFLISAPIGLINAYIVRPLPTSHLGRFARVFRAVVPGVGMGLAFAATTYYATKYRQKDDATNHALGGLAAGTMFGAVNGFSTGAYVSVFCAVLAYVFKYNKEYMEKSKYAKQRNFSPYIMRKKDFVGYPDKGDNWVKAPFPEN